MDADATALVTALTGFADTIPAIGISVATVAVGIFVIRLAARWIGKGSRSA